MSKTSYTEWKIGNAVIRAIGGGDAVNVAGFDGRYTGEQAAELAAAMAEATAFARGATSQAGPIGAPANVADLSRLVRDNQTGSSDESANASTGEVKDASALSAAIRQAEQQNTTSGDGI